MYRPTSITLAIVVLSLTACSAAAQSTACGSRTSAAFAVGMSRNDRMDASASPGQFGGRGAEIVAGLEHFAAGMCFVADLRGGATSLVGAQKSAASETLVDANAGLAALHVFRMAPSTTAPSTMAPGPRLSFAAGVTVRADIAATEHNYADPRRSVSHFRLGVVSAGPVALGRFRLGSGSVTMQLSSPLVALVDHPYTALWAGDDAPHFRIASVAELRGASGSLAYTIDHKGPLTAVFSYHVDALRYDDVLAVRSLSQSLSAGIGVRLAARR